MAQEGLAELLAKVQGAWATLEMKAQEHSQQLAQAVGGVLLCKDGQSSGFWRSRTLCPCPQNTLPALPQLPFHLVECGLRRGRHWYPQKSWLRTWWGPNSSLGSIRSSGMKSGTLSSSPDCAGRTAAGGKWPLHIPRGVSPGGRASPIAQSLRIPDRHGMEASSQEGWVRDGEGLRGQARPGLVVRPLLPASALPALPQVGAVPRLSWHQPFPARWHRACRRWKGSCRSYTQPEPHGSNTEESQEPVGAAAGWGLAGLLKPSCRVSGGLPGVGIIWQPQPRMNPAAVLLSDRPGWAVEGEGRALGPESWPQPDLPVSALFWIRRGCSTDMSI